MGDGNRFYLEEIVEQNSRRVHYQINQLGVYNLCFYRSEITWNASNTNHLDQGILSTYYNFTIRKRIIGLLHLQSSKQSNEIKILQRVSIGASDVTSSKDKNDIWEDLESKLTLNQWRWMYYYIYLNLPIKEIAEQEGVAYEAVLSWGKEFKEVLSQIVKCNAFRFT